MGRSRFSQEQIVGVLKEHEAGAATAALCRRHGISEQTFYRWKQRYGGLERGEARRRGLGPWKKRTPGSSGWWPSRPWTTSS